MELTGKQEDFCKYYVMYGDKRKAAFKAGYSKKTAYQMGHENLKKPNILEKIEELKEKKFKELEITEGYIVDKLKTVLEFDPIDICEIKSNKLIFKKLEDVPPRIRKIIKSIKTKTSGIELVTMDKDKCLEMIARMKGMFKDTLNLSGDLNQTITEVIIS